MEAAIEDSQIDAGLDEPTAAAHTLGPILYQCLFNNTPITRADRPRVLPREVPGVDHPGVVVQETA